MRITEDEVIAVFQAMHGYGAYIMIRFGGGLPTPPDRSPLIGCYKGADHHNVAARRLSSHDQPMGVGRYCKSVFDLSKA